MFKLTNALPCDLEIVRHAEQDRWMTSRRTNVLHILKSRVLCIRTIILGVIWLANALVYYGIVIGGL